MRRTILVVALAAAGCTGEIGSTQGPAAGQRNPDGTPVLGPDGTPVGPDTGPNAVGTPTSTVESPSPRLIRQLTLSEYQNTLADLLHITNPDTNSIPPDVLMGGFTT